MFEREIEKALKTSEELLLKVEKHIAAVKLFEYELEKTQKKKFKKKMSTFFK